MKEEIYILHYPDKNPKNWGVFSGKNCPDPFGFPKCLYRKYEACNSQSSKVFDILMEIKDKLVGLSILPSPDNENAIFPTTDEILNWNDEIKKNVFKRIELVFKD